MSHNTALRSLGTITLWCPLITKELGQRSISVLAPLRSFQYLLFATWGLFCNHLSLASPGFPSTRSFFSACHEIYHLTNVLPGTYIPSAIISCLCNLEQNFFNCPYTSPPLPIFHSLLNSHVSLLSPTPSKPRLPGHPHLCWHTQHWCPAFPLHGLSWHWMLLIIPHLLKPLLPVACIHRLLVFFCTTSCSFSASWKHLSPSLWLTLNAEVCHSLLSSPLSCLRPVPWWPRAWLQMSANDSQFHVSSLHLSTELQASTANNSRSYVCKHKLEAECLGFKLGHEHFA